MDIRGIDHVELYVGDANTAARYFCRAFGFRVTGRGGPETGLRGCRSVTVRQGDIRLVLTKGLTRGHAATSYVRRHGDGVARIAFGTTDARRAYEEAVGRGATAIAEPAVHDVGGTTVCVAEVGGFGDVRHRFVERRHAGEDVLPGVRKAVATADVGGALLETIDHAAICLEPGELLRTVHFYQEVFGFEEIFEEYIQVGEQAMNSKVVQDASGGVTFTLIEPDLTRKPGQIDEFLSKHGGAGVQHLAFSTNDILTAVRTLEERGVAFLTTPASYYDRLEERLSGTELSVDDLRQANVLADRDHWGEMFQIFTRSVHPRGTYFSEVIDRHGARTFGSGNIRALYEAVQRTLEIQRAAS